jgi:phage protein D
MSKSQHWLIAQKERDQKNLTLSFLFLAVTISRLQKKIKIDDYNAVCQGGDLLATLIKERNQVYAKTLRASVLRELAHEHNLPSEICARLFTIADLVDGLWLNTRP